MTDFVSLLLTLAILAAFGLMLGGVVLIRRGADQRLKGGLMIGAGIITLINIYSFATLPA
jgi:hypothetical protein